MKKFTVTLILGWLVCGFFAYGLALGSFSHQFPDQPQEGFSVVWSVTGGPISLIVALATGYPYHFQLKPYTTEQRWEYFHQMYPALDRDYFERNDD